MKVAFYLDENFPIGVAGELIALGHFPSTAVAERRRGASDAHQLLLAADRSWTLLTHNRDDFRLLHEAWLLWSRRWGVSPEHAGILVMQQYLGQTASDIARAIQSLIADDSLALGNALFEWKRSTGWVRFPG